MIISSLKLAKSHARKYAYGYRKGSFKSETESLLIATQNSAMSVSYFKVKVDNTQQNSKCRLYGERDETINHVRSE